MGSPPPLKPQGAVMAGRPFPFMGLVLREMKPDAGPRTRWVSPFRSISTASMRGAGMGAVGVTRKSTSCSTRAYSSLMMRWTFMALE